MPFNPIPFCFTLLFSFLFCSFAPEQPQKKPELQTTPSHLNCAVDETENLHIQADSGQSTAEERDFPQGSLQPVVDTVEQLTAEEKNIHQETKEATDGDTIQEEDSKQAAEEGSTQESVLKQKKNKTEVSCVKSKLKAILLRKGNFIFVAYMDFGNRWDTSNLRGVINQGNWLLYQSSLTAADYE